MWQKLELDFHFGVNANKSRKMYAKWQNNHFKIAIVTTEDNSVYSDRFHFQPVAS